MMENQQLIKKDRSANSYSKIFPWTFTDLVLDRVTKESLDNILVRNNFIALPYVGSKAATRLQVPMKNRRRGIWLSYIDYAGTLTVEYYNDNNLDNNHWQDSSYWLPYNTAEFQPASVGLSALAQEVFDWINSQITTAVKLNPEDLQKNNSGQIEEANRAYDTSTFSGLGYRILRKNIQSNKNVLTQSMINMPNNVYKIRYDFDLNGATINLPANSVLQFVGGSIKNGTLNGNNTAIEADSNAVIFDSVVIEGTWNVEHIYDSWFAFNTSPSYISNQIITNILALSNDDVYNTIHFDADRTYYFELPYKGRANLGDDVRPNYWLLNTPDYDFLRIFTGFTSNTHLIVNNTIQMLPTNQGAYFIFHIENKENITISGTGAINGDAKDHLYTDPFAGTDYYGEWGNVLNFRSCNNVVVRDITIGYAFGDGIALGNAAYNNSGVKEAGLATKNVTIDAVKVLYARRNGISLGGNNYTITNVYFEGNGSDTIKGTAPMAAIDFENDYVDIEPSGLCTNVSMNNCKFKDNKYDVSSTIRDDLYEVPRGELVNISDCNFTSPLRLNRTNGLTFSNCHIVGITNVDNSIAAWYVSKDLVFNNCVFDELNPYLAISAEEQNKKFINPTYPEDIRYSTTFQHSLPVGRALKFTIPKPLVGEVEFTAFCSNPNYSNIQMPVNTTIYTFGPSQRLTGIRDIKIKASQDSTPRYSMYKNTPVFSYINYTEDSNNFIIYFAIGGDLIGDSYASATSVNIFLTSKTKFITVEAPVSGRPDYAGMYGGKWSELSAIIKEGVDISSIPSTVTFPSKEMYSGNMLADLPTSLTADKVGFSQFVLDGTYKRPVFWDSYSNVFRTADGNKALERRVTSLAELDVLTAKLTVDDRGYVVYYTVTTSYLTWRGTDWTNEDGSLFSKVKYIKQTNTIDILNIMFSYSGVIYKICADVDLGGGTLTVATGSTLDFQGGSFSNGTIVGNNTKIIAGLQKIFDTNVIFSGTWALEAMYPQWFGAVGNDINDDTMSFKSMFSAFKAMKAKILVPVGIYKITEPITVSYNDGSQVSGKIYAPIIEGVSYIHEFNIGGGTQIKGYNIPNYRGVFEFLGIDNFYVSTTSIRNLDITLDYDTCSELSFCLFIGDSRNFNIENVTFKGFNSVLYRSGSYNGAKTYAMIACSFKNVVFATNRYVNGSTITEKNKYGFALAYEGLFKELYPNGNTNPFNYADNISLDSCFIQGCIVHNFVTGVYNNCMWAIPGGYKPIDSNLFLSSLNTGPVDSSTFSCSIGVYFVSGSAVFNAPYFEDVPKCFYINRTTNLTILGIFALGTLNNVPVIGGSNYGCEYIMDTASVSTPDSAITFIGGQFLKGDTGFSKRAITCSGPGSLKLSGIRGDAISRQDIVITGNCINLIHEPLLRPLIPIELTFKGTIDSDTGQYLPFDGDSTFTGYKVPQDCYITKVELIVKDALISDFKFNNGNVQVISGGNTFIFLLNTDGMYSGSTVESSGNGQFYRIPNVCNYDYNNQKWSRKNTCSKGDTLQVYIKPTYSNLSFIGKEVVMKVTLLDL